MTRTSIIGVLFLSWAWAVCGAAAAIAQDPPTQSGGTGNATPEQIKIVTDSLNGVKLVGNFTVRGRPQRDLTPEEYYILSAEKQSEGDYWVITARIKYGKNDLTVPMPLEIKFAGDTPVITVDKLMIPGMGTFDARVMIRPDGYAGTWSHDSVGGLMFGEISRMTEAELEELKSANRRNRRDDK